VGRVVEVEAGCDGVGEHQRDGVGAAEALATEHVVDLRRHDEEQHGRGAREERGDQRHELAAQREMARRE
jgi:hypothetical protein